MTKNERFKLETFVATRHKKRYKVLKEYGQLILVSALLAWIMKEFITAFFS